MKPTFKRTLVTVTIIHVLALVVLVGVSAARNRRPATEPVVYLPVSLVSAAPSPAPPAPTPTPTPTPPPPAPAPPKPSPPKPKPERGPLVRRPSPPAPAVSSDDIAKMLELPEPDTTATRPVDDDALCRSIVYRTFYEAWTQPSYDEAGDAIVTATVTLSAGGTVTARSLTGKSGNAALDGSVRRALESVKRIPGLSDSFIAANTAITVSFKVEE